MVLFPGCAPTVLKNVCMTMFTFTLFSMEGENETT